VTDLCVRAVRGNTATRTYGSTCCNKRDLWGRYCRTQYSQLCSRTSACVDVKTQFRPVVVQMVHILISQPNLICIIRAFVKSNQEVAVRDLESAGLQAERYPASLLPYSLFARRGGRSDMRA